jgi:phosphoglucosamine mutase
MFGTDGVRGVANIEPITAEKMLNLGRATAYVCKKHKNTARHRIVIGKDTRISGYMIENALVSGICSMGVDVLLVGPMPTPGIAFITRNMRADAGLVISASHNPYQDNGIKIFSRDGYKLPDAEEDEIEELMLTNRIQDVRPTADRIGKAKRIDDAVGRYIVFCKNTFPEQASIEGMNIVLDCANGATYRIAPIIFSELGAKVTAIHNEPNGTNINDHCGSQHTHDLRAMVREQRADVGLAFDGDGDRLIAVDENGVELNGDHILFACARMYRDLGLLTGDQAVGTVMNNFGLGVAMKEAGIGLLQSDVGDRYVLEMMKKAKATVGGESSGHMIFHNHHTTGDGLITALQLLAVMKHYNCSLSELGSWVKMYPQRLVNVDVASKPPLEDIDALQAAVRRAEEDLGERGRVLVRYSGTQSMCRVMVEGPTEELTDRLATELAGVVKRELA